MEMVISTKQAQAIASYIFADVAAYVAAHPAEFEAFCKEVSRHAQSKKEISEKGV